VRAGLESDDVTGAVVPPLHLSSTFAFRGYGDKRKYDYSRSGNPTRDLLGNALADLEEGAGGVITASGMAAITVTGYLLQQGARIVAPHDCYGGTYRLFDAWNKRGDLKVDFVRFADADALERALQQPTAMVWIETPSNPLLRVTDIEVLSRRAHEIGALVVVDNTFLSPGWQKPLTLGADIVVHSTTKYLNGHSDVVGGAVIAAKKEVHEKLAWWANCLGLTGAPFDSFMTLRGLRTLDARLAVHGRNAEQLAAWLHGQAGVQGVLPRIALASRPRHRAPAADRLWRDRHLRAGRRHRGRQAFCRWPAVLFVGRIPRRRGKPRRASGFDDPCGDGARSPCSSRARRWPVALVDWHRSSGRSA
jgi:cystathionine gamma-synthase